MTHRLCPRAASALLPVATAALAIGICIADILTGVAVALAVLYVAVVLMSARFLPPTGHRALRYRVCRPDGVELFSVGRECDQFGYRRRGNRVDDLSRAEKPIGRSDAARASQPP